MYSFLLVCSLGAAEVSTTDGDYEKSQVYLSVVKVSAENQMKVLYLKSVNAFGLNDKKAATSAIDQFQLAMDSETPVRYRNLVYCLKNNLELWDNPLLDIERDMRISGDKLNSGYHGKRTQEIQEEIVRKLNKLIKDTEDEKKRQMAKANGEGEGSDKGQLPGSRGQQPMPDSLPTSGDSGTGKVTEQQLQKLAGEWGGLPPEKRAKAIDDLTRELPTKYKPLIDAYFKSLQKIKP